MKKSQITRITMTIATATDKGVELNFRIWRNDFSEMRRYWCTSSALKIRSAEFIRRRIARVQAMQRALADRMISGAFDEIHAVVQNYLRRKEA